MIVPVVTVENSDLWITQASNLSKRQLEKEIIKVRLQAATPERVSYTSEKRIRLEMGLSEADMLRLRRAQDLVSQSQRRPATLEETLQALCGEFLSRKDPVERAKRQHARGRIRTVSVDSRDPAQDLSENTGAPRRVPVPSAIRHAVNIRDENRCAHIVEGGNRCGESRWIELHHRTPVSHGGANTAANLVTLCAGHHRAMHQ